MLQEFLSKTKLAALSLIIVAIASIFFYVRFEAFKPEEGVDLKQIEGNRIASNNNVPKPDDAEILGVSRSDTSVQTTYRTSKEPKGILEFYRNILQNEGWEIDMQETIDSSLQSKFIKENLSVTVTASPQENSEKTVVSVNQIKK